MNKFYRSDDNSYVGGVCGGLGKYTGIDPIIWRLIFIFASGPLIWIYIAMWVFTERR